MSSSTTLSVLAGMGALRSNPLRATLSTLGVIIGVASLVAILSIGDSLEKFSRDQIVQTTDLQSIAVSSRTHEVVDGIRIELVDPIRLTGEDFLQLSNLLSDEAEVVPMVSSSARASVVGDTASVVILVTETTPEALPRINSGLVKHGQFLSHAGEGDRKRNAVVSMALAKRLSHVADDSLLIGEKIEVELAAETAEYEITGILDGDGSGRPRIITPIDIEGSFGPADKFPSLTVRARTIELVEPVVDKVETWLGDRYPGEEGKFSIQTSQARVEQVAQGMLVFKLGLGAIAAISLVVGGIGIMNVLLASVAERTREIGVRKAAGAKKNDILMQFLAESVSITGFGAILGAVVGLVASAAIMIGIRSFTGAPVGVAYTWTSILWAAVAAIVIGIAFGMFPAVRASKLSPVDAIRHE